MTSFPRGNAVGGCHFLWAKDSFIYPFWHLLFLFPSFLLFFHINRRDIVIGNVIRFRFIGFPIAESLRLLDLFAFILF